jgi:DNA-binding transcriptional ArsR family regulator
VSVNGNGQSFEWALLVPRLVHPLKVAIIEALEWTELPLSAKDVDRVLDEEYGLSLVSYHMRKLAEVGAIERVEQRAVRGALQSFYALAAAEPVVPKLFLE